MAGKVSAARPLLGGGQPARTLVRCPGDAFRGPLLIDVSRLIWRASTRRLPTGIDRACLAYLRHYHAHARAVIQLGGMRTIINPQASAELFALLMAERQDFMRAFRRMALRWPLVWQKAESGRGEFYLHLAHTGVEKGNLGGWVRKAGLRPIFFVHDIIPLSHAEYCRDGERQRHAARINTMLREGCGLICNSRETLNELTTYADHLGLPLPPACIAWLGIDGSPPLTPLPPAENGNVERLPVRPPGEPYFVMLGTIEARKNHLLILHAWEQLIKELGPAAPRLKIVGQRGWECHQTIAMLDRCAGLGDHVDELSDCSDTMLAELIRGSCALLFPSQVEGFGLPLVEALANGTPVIASDLPVFRELAGAIPEYLNPIDGLGWKAAIRAYADPQNGARAAQIQRMRGFTPSRWSTHFDRVDHWLNALSVEGRASGQQPR